MIWKLRFQRERVKKCDTLSQIPARRSPTPVFVQAMLSSSYDHQIMNARP